MLLLFDIDGTLLTGTRQWVGEAMRVALKEVHGVDTSFVRARIPTAGRTDGEIARAVLVDAGVPSERIDALAGRVREIFCQACAPLLPDNLSQTLLPGVRQLLDWLVQQEDVKLGLLTGNYEPIAWLKLTRAGIGEAFPFGQGAFGSDAEDRSALPEIARRRAGMLNAPYPRQDTIVVGDTPRDISCARADRLRCVAIASGPFGSEALTDADAVARNAAELPQILQALGSVSQRAQPAGVSLTAPRPRQLSRVPHLSRTHTPP